MRRKNPCFPPDCPDRTAECHSTCKKWAEYEAEKFADYEVRDERLKAKLDFNDYVKAATRRMATTRRARGKKKHET